MTGKTREMGLGSVSTVALAEARGQADGSRPLLRAGTDPLDARKTAPATNIFGEYADAYIASVELRWRNAEHRWQWRAVLMDDAGATWVMPDVSLLTDGLRPAAAFPVPFLVDVSALWVRQKAEVACAPEDCVAAAVASDDIAPDMPRSAEEPPRPVQQRLVVAGATPGDLAEIAGGTPGSLLVRPDELAGWLGGFARFGGDGQADRAFAIEWFGGRRFTVDRVKHCGRPIIVQHLPKALIGSIQPERLAGVPSGVDAGLAARFLWTRPSAPPAFRIARDRSDNGEVRHAFARLCGLPLDTSEEGQPILPGFR